MIDTAQALLTDTGANRQTFEDETSWLEERRKSVGASESPDLIGCGFADGGPAAVWERKVRGETAPKESELLALGQIIEPAVRGACRVIRGLDVIDPQGREMWRHPSFPHMHATLDGLVVEDGRAGVLETKNVSSFGRADWEDGAVPLRVQTQVQHQLACTGLSFGYAAGLIGGSKLQTVRIERNDEFIAAIHELIEQFWQRVEAGEMPPVDGRTVTAAVLSRLHPDDNGETIELPDDVDTLLNVLAEVKQSEKTVKKAKAELENRLRAALGDNTYGQLPSGRVVSWKTQDRKGFTVEPTSYRVLRVHTGHPLRK